MTREHGDEPLEIRARPRPVSRINRRVLMVIAALGLLALFAATFIALNPPRLGAGDGGVEPAVQPAARPAPEGLDRLPRRYSDIETPTRVTERQADSDVPRLGAPLPGDLGGAVLHAERELGLGAEPLPFRPSPEDDAARAERIRQARLAQQGRESGVFFQLTRGSASTSASAASAAPSGLQEMDQFVQSLAASNQALLQAGQGGTPAANDPSSVRLGAAASGHAQSPHGLVGLGSPYTVLAGSLISASLITGVNSDLPGLVIAQVTQPVFDSVSGHYLLIPQGSRLIGRYDSLIEYGQDRALIVWDRIIRPDGSSIAIDNWPGVDAQGRAGLADEVDHHGWRLLRGAGLSTLLSLGAALGDEESEGDLSRALREAVQETADDVGQDIVRRNLDLAPTITIRPGWPLRVIVHRDLVMTPYAEVRP